VARRIGGIRLQRIGGVFESAERTESHFDENARLKERGAAE